MDTNDFLNLYGSILFRGYWRGGKDGNPRIRNGKNEPVPLDKALEKYHYLLGALQPHVVIVDYDTPEAFECRLQIAREKQEHCIVIILALIAICIIFYITKQFSLFNSTIRKYIKEWNRYAFENKRIEEQDYKNNIKKLNLE